MYNSYLAAIQFRGRFQRQAEPQIKSDMRQLVKKEKQTQLLFSALLHAQRNGNKLITKGLSNGACSSSGTAYSPGEAEKFSA